MSTVHPMVLQPPRQSSSQTKSGFKVNVMQLNAWLIPVRASFPDCLDFHAFRRAERMAAWLETEAVNRSLDVAIFQEVWTPWRSFVASLIHSVFCCRLFGRHFIEGVLRRVLPYFTRVHGSRACDCTKRFFDSGLVIASRYPIIAEQFKIYPSGSPHDALSSKGVLVAALRRPDDTILIVASSHLDAGDDDSVKLSQLDIAVAFIQSFSESVRVRFPEFPIVGTVLGSDMNIDGIEFWDASNSYSKARDKLNRVGFQDSWLLTPRDVPSTQEVARDGIHAIYRPEKYPALGITSDQTDCVKRLDYVWVCPGEVQVGNAAAATQSMVSTAAAYHISESSSVTGEVTMSTAPSQVEMSSRPFADPAVVKHHTIPASEIKQFGVFAKTELNDGVLWQSEIELRAQIQAAMKLGDKSLLQRLRSTLDLRDRKERLSDHAAIFAQLTFS